MPTIPSSHADILNKRAFAHLTTLMPDGSPQTSPVWVEATSDAIRVNSAQGRVKDRNMRRDARVALSATDPDNPYRCLMVRGRVVKVETDGADAHIDKLAKKYMDVDTYPFRTAGEVRVIYTIEPTHVSVMG